MSERRLQAPAFPDDTGSADPALVAALTAYDTGRGSYGDALAALAIGRLLVPVVAVLGESEVVEQADEQADEQARGAGLVRDKSADMAAVLMQGADGRRALLAFTGTEALAAWNPEARPVPVPSATAALAALQEEAAAVVVDVAGPVRFVVEGQALQALAASVDSP